MEPRGSDETTSERDAHLTRLATEAGPSATRQGATRHLSLHHFAFMRGYLQGLSLPQLARRYLEAGLEESGPRRVLAFVRDALRALALQHGQTRYARALAIDPARLVEAAPASKAALTLEAFGKQIDPKGLLLERELLELYCERMPASKPDRRQGRAARLRALQLEALDFLQTRAQPLPRAEQPVEAWLPPRIAAHLVAAGIPTLGDLVKLMNTAGFRWWRTVPRIGARKAMRLRAWLAGYANVEGLALERAAVVPRERLGTTLDLLRARAVRSEIAPLERFLVPRELDGRQGRLRADPARTQIAAENDYEAIAVWLGARATNDNTWRAYRREAERLLLWCVFARGKALSSITVEDCIAYRDFLQDPPPQWTSARNVQRWSPAWRPLAGPLSPRSLRTAFTIASSLFDWLVSQQYLIANPWKALPRPGRVAALDLSRAFTHPQWDAIRTAVERIAPEVRRVRLRLVSELLYHTGLRRAELLAANLGDLREELLEGEPCWVLTVAGKGGRIREVPIVQPVMAHLAADLALRGQPTDPRDGPPGAALIARINEPADGRRGATPPGARAERMPSPQLYRELKRVFEAASEQMRAAGVRGAGRVARGSPHWLRHTFATHAIETVPADVVGSVLGHASMATTTLYTRTELRRKVNGLRRFAGN